MECDICLIEWDPIVHIPRIMSCGHTICEACLLSMLRKAISRNEELFCPSCMTKQKEIKREDDIKKLIKNINLLRITEKIDSRKSMMFQSFLTSRDNFNESLLMKNNNNFSTRTLNDRTYIFSTNELTCVRHGLQVHSYAVGTNLYLCDLCIEETPQKTLPLPNYIRETKRKIDSTEVKICLLKQELERLQEFFASYLEEFESSNLAKIDDLFEYLNRLLMYNYNTAKTVIAQSKKEQANQIELKTSELKMLSAEITSIEKKLKEIKNENEDRNLIKYNDYLLEIYNKVICFINYDMELNLFQMKFGLKENIKEEAFEFIQNSYHVDVDFAKVNGEPPMIKHILQRDKLWQCLCGEIENANNDSKCSNCGIFRKLETYENLLANPLFSTKEEIVSLNMRRKLEVKDFKEIYNNKSSDSEENNINKFYVLDIEWFLLWKCFVTNDLSDKYISNSKKRISPNKSVGVLPPGQITTSNLFEKGTKEFTQAALKKSLKKNDDYILVNAKTWNFFHFNYNAAIELQVENNKDIYSSFISSEEVKYFFLFINHVNPVNKAEIELLTSRPVIEDPQQNYLEDNIKTEKNEESVIFNELVNLQTVENENKEQVELFQKDSSSDINTYTKGNEEEEEDHEMESSYVKFNTEKRDVSSIRIQINQPMDEDTFDKGDLNNTVCLSEFPGINPTTNYDFEAKFNRFKLTQNKIVSPIDAYKEVSQKLKIFFDN